MKVETRRVSVAILSVVCALFLILGVTLFDTNNAFQTYAESAEQITSTYYYDHLKNLNGSDYAMAKEFYDILDELNTTGDFKDGVINKELSEVLTPAEIASWVENGNLDIPKAFGAARDSYYYDHPELFYVDLYKLTLSAGRVNGTYVAYLDCGTEADCYMDNGALTSETAVNNAIAAYEQKIQTIVTYVKTSAAQNSFGTAQDMLWANYANEYIAGHVEYDYEALTAANASENYSKPYIGNAYGALIEGKCVCSGYSFAYKAVMDALDIPCVIVSGISIDKSTDGVTDKGEAHSWNYVWLQVPQDDNVAEAVALADTATAKNCAWYAYDVTWNSTGSDSSAYVNMSAYTASVNHLADPVISTSGYNMPYPELSAYNYGAATVESDFYHSSAYTPYGNETDNSGNPLMQYVTYVSYKGKGAIALLEDGLHIVYRHYAYNDDTNEMYWTAWCDIGNMYKDTLGMTEEDEGNQTYAPIAYNCMYTQFAVVDIEPDINYNPDDKILTTSHTNFYYSKDNADFGEQTVYISPLYTNKAFGTYTAAPYVVSTTPRHTGVVTINDSMGDGTGSVADSKAFEISVTYDENLHVLDSSKPIGIEFVSSFANIDRYAGFVAYEDGSYVKIVNGNTLTFKFKPSLMYEHNSELYSFYFSNVGSTKLMPNGNTSDKLPNPAHFHFARSYMQCPLILGHGKLWIDCCAQPTLVSNSDLAAMDFKDPDGNSTFSEQARSQMMLVAESVKPEVENAMLSEINKSGLKTKDIKASETYDINLQICGKYPVIPDGSYVKIALGFPEGYGPEDEGVTFKLYHRKHVSGDKYIIEEVPCVVTQLGIVATVTSFSPYMVVAADAKTVSANKTIYATIDGKGGTLSREDGKVQTLSGGATYTYTVTPDEGYGIYKVMLNGQDVTSSVQNGKLTVGYDDLLNNNELVIKYISDVAAQRYAANDLEVVDPVTVVVSTKGEASIAKPSAELAINTITPAPSNNAAIIVIVCVAVAVVAAACIVAFILIKRKRNNAEK
ncbi:MAG: hypothetical protein NC332_03405 [Firmicutes bacterium]|nr:hypothetical protein [Bacillota bacterium]